MGLHQLYKNEEYCIKELAKAREILGNRNKVSSWGNVIKMLGIMFLYCPPSLSVSVEAQLSDAVRRQMFIETMPPQWMPQCGTNRS